MRLSWPASKRKLIDLNIIFLKKIHVPLCCKLKSKVLVEELCPRDEQRLRMESDMVIRNFSFHKGWKSKATKVPTE